jgi:uncharacterized protein YjbI with pentapeptide repeats
VAASRPRAARPPRIDFVRPTTVHADALAIVARDERESERFADSDLSGVDLAAVNFVECELVDLTLTDTQLRGARFVETAMERSFASSLLAARTTWRSARIDAPRWGSAELFEAELASVHIRGGKIGYLNLRNARLTDVLIEDCVITELDLGGVKAERLALANCRIETLDLTRASCIDVDLRSTDFSAVQGIEGLRGTVVDELQLSRLAPVLAGYLGLIVED